MSRNETALIGNPWRIFRVWTMVNSCANIFRFPRHTKGISISILGMDKHMVMHSLVCTGLSLGHPVPEYPQSGQSYGDDFRCWEALFVAGNSSCANIQIKIMEYMDWFDRILALKSTKINPHTMVGRQTDVTAIPYSYPRQ